MTKAAAVGAVRPSQLLWTYGPGALVDLPNLSVLTMGLEHWDVGLCGIVDEPRLLAAVRSELGQQVQSLRRPPVADEDVDPLSPEALRGVPVRPFPRWLRCVRCGLLAEYDSGLFELVPDKYRPDRTRFVHPGCEKGKKSDAVPARFLLACSKGHLDDFPWHWFVHGGPTVCKGTLRFFESGASLQTENLWVRCDGCKTSRSLVHAFGEEGKKTLPACRGRHPHLDAFDKGCDERPRPVILGATNAWFPVTLSALAIPQASDAVGQFVTDAWDDLRDADDASELKGVLKQLEKQGRFPEIAQFDVADIWIEVSGRKAGTATSDEPTRIDEEELKRPEWKVLTSPSSLSDWPHFLAEQVDVPDDYAPLIRSVSLVKRLREVNALLGFTRVDSPEEVFDAAGADRVAALTRKAPTWVPASEVHGEGVFLRFDESALRSWLDLPAVKERDARLFAGHRGWRTSRGLPAEDRYPGVRYAMLHTLSHLLVREFALECGYNAASIRERIYASDDADPMAGILLYTAAADADGTLGGLVELGKPQNLGRILGYALHRARVCSSDPLCSEHDPGTDRSLHAAACHACGFVAETSCERGNRYLDRALLLPTFECPDAGYFIRP